MNKKYKLSSNYLLHHVGNDTVLLPCGNDDVVDFSKMIVLNETGAVLVSIMEHNAHSLDELVVKLEQEFEATAEQIRPNVVEFVKQMVQSHLLVIEEK